MPGDRSRRTTGGVERHRRASARLQATAIVSLNAEAYLVIRFMSRIALQRRSDLRDWMAKVVIPAFLKANVATLVAIAVLAILDEFNIAWDWIAAGDRIISAQVIMALLGATTVQVGAIAVLIARYLFPGRPP